MHSFALVDISDSELEELGESPARYRPDSLQALSKATKFTEAEIKRIYRNFKAECPMGVVREDTFKGIYSQFFPQGGKKTLNPTYCQTLVPTHFRFGFFHVNIRNSKDRYLLTEQ